MPTAPLNPNWTMPTWLHNTRISPARGQDGQVLGIELRCLVEHDRITELPDLLLEQFHAVLDYVVPQALII